jgi:5-formyltetrahydrofolate cyclo-ligase
MKKNIRSLTLRKRDEIPKIIRAVKDSLIKEKVFSLPEFLKASMIFFYASFRSEVETLSLIKESISMGKRVVLPKVNRKNQNLMLYEIKDIIELKLGYMGIPEPAIYEKRLIQLEDVDLVIAPGVAFDCSGNRLGYGGGYYDILLSGRKKETPIIALAYEEQIVDSIPSELHDVKVDMIITDTRIIKP